MKRDSVSTPSDADSPAILRKKRELHMDTEGHHSQYCKSTLLQIFVTYQIAIF